jgi:hypothetical protein
MTKPRAIGRLRTRPLEQIDWSIEYLSGIHKKSISRRLAQKPVCDRPEIARAGH